MIGEIKGTWEIEIQNLCKRGLLRVRAGRIKDCGQKIAQFGIMPRSRF